jgi:hypothetical protein
MPSSQHALMEATKKRVGKLEAKGKPVDFKELLRMEPDGGTTNIRGVAKARAARIEPRGRRLFEQLGQEALIAPLGDDVARALE